ncbi:translation initiation factor IF-2-like [Phodopus roborovskii]|uniref:translation initiation factor IF-2-like n=1 Tax=Phodopus roborovskii TaxID=109678 RepID=UPI0021E4B815|nr:translation initiation factor IF-2-like [Phodopus roborovskii]
MRLTQKAPVLPNPWFHATAAFPARGPTSGHDAVEQQRRVRLPGRKAGSGTAACGAPCQLRIQRPRALAAPAPSRRSQASSRRRRRGHGRPVPGALQLLLAAGDPGQTSGWGAVPVPEASVGNPRRCRGELGSRVAPRAVAPARWVPPASWRWPPHGALRRRAGRAGPGPGTRALAPSSGPRRLRPGRDVGSFQPACGAPPVSRGAGAPRAAGVGSAIGAPPPEVAGSARGQAAGSERAVTARATAPRAARSRAGAALRRAQRRIPARIWARRARPPFPLPAAPDSKPWPAGGQEDPEHGPRAREPRDFGLVQLLPLSGLVFRRCSDFPGCLRFRLASPSASRFYRPPPLRGGPARAQHHEDTWDLPGDFGWTFANCGRGDVFRRLPL